MKYLLVTLAGLVGLWGSACPALAETPPPPTLRFGVVPQQSVTELARVWTPVLAYLSRKTGYVLEFRTGHDIVTFEQRVNAGEFDFAYFNPLQYATHRSSGYQAIARERDTQLVGIVVVAKDSAYKSLKDIDGLTMAIPSPVAVAASILPQLSLKQMGASVVPKVVASHESVYRTVARGLYPAGGGIMKTFEQVDPAVHDKLRILWKSAPYTPHPIAAHSRVAKAVVQRVTAALLAMADDPQGAQLLKAAGYKGFIAAKDSDYDDIRALQTSIGLSSTAPKTK